MFDELVLLFRSTNIPVKKDLAIRIFNTIIELELNGNEWAYDVLKEMEDSKKNESLDIASSIVATQDLEKLVSLLDSMKKKV